MNKDEMLFGGYRSCDALLQSHGHNSITLPISGFRKRYL